MVGGGYTAVWHEPVPAIGRGVRASVSHGRTFRHWRDNRGSRGFAVGIEGAKAAAAPAGRKVTGIVAGVVRATQPVGQFHERAEQGGAVVV